MPASTPDDPPRDQVTDVLRGIVAREADAARKDVPARVRYLGDYELLEEIARGGMGIVYRARQVSLNREVALKMILAGELADQEAVSRFQSEAEAAANLTHPGIVSIYEIGEHDGQHYFSMEFVEGRSLAELVADGPLTAKRAATYVRKVAEAIQYAHEQGTLHRDIKPSNVLIDASDEPRVTDFGLAKRIASGPAHTLTGAAVGTPSYMPPEQASGKRALLGPASDVYSLGALLYELVTGRPPFQADNPVETLMQVLEHEPAAPRLVNPSVPTDLETICLKCLAKRPEERYASAQELADELERFLARVPIEARPAGRMRRAWSFARTHPWVITAGAVSVSIAVLGFAYWLWAERALWQHLAAHPDYVRERGARSAHVEVLLDNTSWMFVTLFWLDLMVMMKSPKLKRFHSDARYLTAFAVIGAIGLAVGIYLTKAATDAWVWEGSLRWRTVLDIIVVIYFATSLVTRTSRALQRRAAGTLTDLTVEQEDELYELLAKGPKNLFGRRRRLAKQRYREWTNADELQVNAHLRQMQKDLYVLHPELIPRPPRSIGQITLLAIFIALAFFIVLAIVISIGARG